MATGRSTHRVQRNTNDSVPIIGSALVPDVDNSVNDALHDTMSQGMSNATRRNYRGRISKIIKHFKENFQEYYQIGVCELTEEEMADRTKYYFKEKEDLIYTGLNVQFFMFFLSSTDKRADGKLSRMKTFGNTEMRCNGEQRLPANTYHQAFMTQWKSTSSPTRRNLQVQKNKAMWKSTAPTQSPFLFIVFCFVGQSKQAIYLRGRGRYYSGIAWLGAHQLIVWHFTTLVWAQTRW